MKEVLKNVGKILLHSPVPKYVSIPVGIVASGFMSLDNSARIRSKKFQERPSWRLEEKGLILTNILALGCFAGLAVTSLTSRFNVLPKPVVGGLLLLTGGAEALLYYKYFKKCYYYRETLALLTSLSGITVAGGVYLAREGFNLLSSSK